MDNIWLFARDSVVQGTFDRYLVRPINPFFQMISERFQSDAFGELAMGIIILAVSIPKLSIPSYTVYNSFCFYCIYSSRVSSK
jgi:ABC-2 type transport system permease protein